jgi:hypothetical protein
VLTKWLGEQNIDILGFETLIFWYFRPGNTPD